MGELEEQIVKGAELLVSLLLDAPCPTTDAAIEDHLTEQCTCVHDAMPDSPEPTLKGGSDKGTLTGKLGKLHLVKREIQRGQVHIELYMDLSSLILTS